jgi:hypothetical protein
VIERLHEEFRRRVKTQGSLPTEDAALVLLFGLVVSGQIRLRRLDGWRQIPAMLRARLELGILKGRQTLDLVQVGASQSGLLDEQSLGQPRPDHLRQWPTHAHEREPS